MKLLVNSKDTDGISFKLHYQGFCKINNIKFNDFDNYDKYDVVLFFIYDLKKSDLERAKKLNNKIIIGLIDPRSMLNKPILNVIDFVVVDSLEMQDYFLRTRKPIIKYLEFESTLVNKTIRKNDDSILIGYHGNKVHLLSMYPTVWKALSLLSKKYKIKVILLYNYKNLGKIPNFMLKGIEVEHLQWNKNNLDYFLKNTDIGIVPNFTKIFFNKIVKRISMPFMRTFVAQKNDYLVSFKLTSGPNRILTFANNKIPIVADMCPSACQIINHENDGFLAFSENGWYISLEKLINNSRLRKKISKRMHQKFMSHFDYEIQNEKFLNELNYLYNSIENRELHFQKSRSTNFSIRPFLYFSTSELFMFLKKLISFLK